MKKFKVGDRVTIKESAFGSGPHGLLHSEWYSGKRFIVERVDSDINTFEPDKWIYYLRGFKSYFYDTHLCLDMQYYRNKKIQSILNDRDEI